MKSLFVFTLVLLILAFSSNAQSSFQKGGTSYASFLDYQKNFTRPGEALKKKEDTWSVKGEIIASACDKSINLTKRV